MLLNITNILNIQDTYCFLFWDCKLECREDSFWNSSHRKERGSTWKLKVKDYPNAQDLSLIICHNFSDVKKVLINNFLFPLLQMIWYYVLMGCILSCHVHLEDKLKWRSVQFLNRFLFQLLRKCYLVWNTYFLLPLRNIKKQSETWWFWVRRENDRQMIKKDRLSNGTWFSL